MIMDKMIAYCGLDCSKCDAYLATIHDDWNLRKKTAELWSKLNNITISPDEINCEGCRNDGVKTYFCDKLCQIRRCAIENKMNTCGECAKLLKCDKVSMVVGNNQEALKNLKG